MIFFLIIAALQGLGKNFFSPNFGACFYSSFLYNLKKQAIYNFVSLMIYFIFMVSGDMMYSHPLRVVISIWPGYFLWKIIKMFGEQKRHAKCFGGLIREGN